jgi:DNA-binding NarL/FixJ family response regulator
MGIAEATIKMHVTAIFKILEVTNRTQAAMITKENGLLLGN